MDSAPRSAIFGDIYFSPGNGREESEYVFLKGNNLPDAWKGRDRFTIVETGFGTGLNFLLARDLFCRTRSSGQELDFFSFEKYPLSEGEIAGFLLPLGIEGEKLDDLIRRYPLRVPGFHPLEPGDGVRLVLVFGDVNEAMPGIRVRADAWFLDGFAPSVNPDMWSGTVFGEMSRLSAPGASFATFTAAGVVKKGLGEAGFSVERIKGFGQKKHMLTGKLITAPEAEPEDNAERRIRKVCIVGAGLAGTACAWLLRKHGIESVIYEATDDIAGGASGNQTGIFNPRFSAGWTPESEFYSSAYSLAIRTMQELQREHDIKYSRCGTLHLVNSPVKEKRYRDVLKNWGWHSDHMRYLDDAQASEVAGVKVRHQALYLPDSGSVSPAAMCAAYSKGTEVHLGVQLMMHDITRRQDDWLVLGRQFDAIVLACGEGAKWFEETRWLPVHTVRGQIIQAEDSGFGDDISCNINYGGYISPGENGVHTLGSTFQRWLTHTDVLEEDNAEIIGRLRETMPEADGAIHAVNARAGLRTTAKDHFPIAGKVPDLTSWKLGQDGYVPDLYLTTAHGSHGIISSIATATLITDLLLSRAPGMSGPVVEQLNASRFLKRARRKGALDRF